MTAIELAANSDRIATVTARGYTGSTMNVRAGTFVLACGGLENPRMLLLMQRKNEAHDSIRNDNLGRFFMEHLEVRVGRYVTSDTHPEFAREREYYAPTPDFMRERRILNCCVRVYPSSPYADGSWRKSFLDLSCRADWMSAVSDRLARACLRHGRTGGGLHCATEQAPNPDSRVTLAETSDRFGLPKLRLDWRLSDVDKRTMRETILEFGRYLAANDIGRVRTADWLLEEDDQIPGLAEGQRVAGYHHMGTTRMAADARRGVVDADCRYFGIDNLYLAGSSIFSTGGYANPTYTLLQFAMRLGDHLIGVTAQNPVQVS